MPESNTERPHRHPDQDRSHDQEARRKMDEERLNQAKRRENAEHGDPGTERQVGRESDDRVPPSKGNA